MDVVLDEGLKTELYSALVDAYFSKQSTWTTADDLSDGKRREIDRHVFARYDEFVDGFMPWLSRHIDLRDANVLEIGCGTGSSAAALAPHVKHITGWDINRTACEGARARMNVMGIRNVSIFHNDPASASEAIDERHEDATLDVVLIYAVLEHQTVEERLETLSLVWRKLKQDGYLVIGETPNRLTYFDVHKSRTAFFHLLPIELQKHYFDKSGRPEFVADLRNKKNTDDATLTEALIRWGQSVGHQEFEIALGKQIHGQVIASGHDPEILKIRPYRPEEKYLIGYLDEIVYKMNVAFSRYYHDIIFRKTDNYKWNPNFSKLKENAYRWRREDS